MVRVSVRTTVSVGLGLGLGPPFCIGAAITVTCVYRRGDITVSFCFFQFCKYNSGLLCRNTPLFYIHSCKLPHLQHTAGGDNSGQFNIVLLLETLLFS